MSLEASIDALVRDDGLSPDEARKVALQLAALHETMPELERWLNGRLAKARKPGAPLTILGGIANT